MFINCCKGCLWLIVTKAFLKITNRSISIWVAGSARKPYIRSSIKNVFYVFMRLYRTRSDQFGYSCQWPMVIRLSSISRYVKKTKLKLIISFNIYASWSIVCHSSAWGKHSSPEQAQKKQNTFSEIEQQNKFSLNNTF